MGDYQLAAATDEAPCLVLSLRLDMSISMVRELLGREEIHVAETPSDSPAMSIGNTTPEFLNACCRLLDLLDSPQDIPFLSGLIQREIIYRVLRGRVGARLRAVATLCDQSHRTAKSIAWITANYAKPLHVEELAQIASMGVSTLHHHFRMLTAMSPLQYQKQLRLQSAPHRFRKSRDVGCYLGLQPGRRNSGQSEPQMHISKELRRWGLKLAERGGKNGKKRAIIATARKLAVLLHRLWVSAEVYEPLRNSSRMTMPAAA